MSRYLPLILGLILLMSPVPSAGASQAASLTAGAPRYAQSHEVWLNASPTYAETGRMIAALVGGATAIAVEAGGHHACAIILTSPTGSGPAEGSVKCWGRNDYGQLGDGTTIERNSPVDVKGLSGNVIAIAAGIYHTCAITKGGGVKCWGWNDYGQLGDGTTTSRSTPVDVSGLPSGMTAITAEGNHTCTITGLGGVKCWGKNDHGQQGDGTTTERHTPVDVSGLASGVTAVNAGEGYACALTAGGRVQCWGRNDYGQLGDGTTTSRFTPVDVSDLNSRVTGIVAGGYHTCVITAGGGVKCWGYNGSGQLGNGKLAELSKPVDVSGMTSGVTGLAAEWNHSCAITAAGGVKCWGENFFGGLGDGTTTARSTPVDVVGLAGGVTAIAEGEGFTCALTAGGGVKCWGYNGSGQLGDGTTVSRSTPVDVNGLASKLPAIAAGEGFTCTLTMASTGKDETGGGVRCWGRNDYGQLGDGTLEDRSTPADVSGLAGGVTAISAGQGHVCALLTGGGLKCWGLNDHGQLGDGTTTARSTPVDVGELASGVTNVGAGANHTCALTASGGVKCWGSNDRGGLGDGTTTERHTPVDSGGVAALASGVRAAPAP